MEKASNDPFDLACPLFSAEHLPFSGGRRIVEIRFDGCSGLAPEGIVGAPGQASREAERRTAVARQKDARDRRASIDIDQAAKDLYAGPWRPGGGVVGALVGGGLGFVLGYIFGWLPFATMAVGAVFGALVGWFLVSESFMRITFPLSLPGVFAGSLLTFIPAIGDYVNADFLGNTETRMIGNVIQSKFLESLDYPGAAALSFILMGLILVMLLLSVELISRRRSEAAADPATIDRARALAEARRGRGHGRGAPGADATRSPSDRVAPEPGARVGRAATAGAARRRSPTGHRPGAPRPACRRAPSCRPG